jgi:hypothetical protein
MPQVGHLRALGFVGVATLASQVAVLVVCAAVFTVSISATGPNGPRTVGIVGSAGAAIAVVLAVRRWLRGGGMLMTVVNMAFLVAVFFYTLAATLLVAGALALLIFSPLLVACAIGMLGSLRPPA